MITGFVLIGLYILISGNILTDRATDSFYDYNLNDKREQAKLEVTNRLDEINFEKGIIINDEKERLKNVLLSIKTAINSPKLSKDMITKLVEDEISIQTDYNYFMLDNGGNLLSTNDEKNFQESSLNEEISQIISSKDGLFLTMNWPKKRTIYAFYLKEYEYILGLGVCHDDIDQKLKTKIYSRLQTYYEDKNNYIFVTEYDSTARVSADPSLIGKKMNQFTSFDGNSIHLQFMEVMNSGDDGYITYRYYKKNSDELTEKMTYVHKLEGWDAYIGMGFHLDDLQGEVVNYSKLFKQHYYNQALYIVLGLTLLSLIVYAVFQRGAYMQKMLLKQGDIIYDKLFELSNEAIVVISINNELLYQNIIAEKLFKNRSIKYLREESPLLLTVEEDIFSFYHQNGRQYFIKIRTEMATYNNRESKIFFVSDISKDYLQSHKLEQMAYIDELTQLANRRSLIDDFDDLKHNYNPDSIYILGMLDIDHFKVVNDTHGHNIGDIVLKELANTFINTLRHNDKLYRYGGEEFVLLLSQIDLEKSKEVINKINYNFNQTVSETLGFNCTFSCGLIKIDNRTITYTLEELILRADELLYRAKDQGRNRVEI